MTVAGRGGCRLGVGHFFGDRRAAPLAVLGDCDCEDAYQSAAETWGLSLLRAGGRPQISEVARPRTGRRASNENDQGSYTGPVCVKSEINCSLDHFPIVSLFGQGEARFVVPG